jgi:6-phosphofructokinase 1
MLAEGAGDAYDLRDEIIKRIGLSVRCTVLGYIQRGGTPSASDRLMGSKMGAKAVELLIDGVANVVIGTKGGKIFSQDIEEALEMEKVFDTEAYELAKILSI